MGLYSADLTQLIKDLEAAPRRVQDRTETVLDQVANEILTEQLATSPVDSGKLKGTLHVERRPGWRSIGADHAQAPHDIYVEYGTAAHVIKASPGKTLAFSVGGQMVFAKSVRHPGTKPNPFIRNSLTKWADSVGPKMAKVGQEAIIRG